MVDINDAVVIPTNGSGLPLEDLLANFARPSADVLELYHASNPQAFLVYNARIDGSNYERGFFQWTSNSLEIGTEKAGTGVARKVVLRSSTSVIVLTNSASNDFNSLLFGGESNAFPALQRFGQGLRARVADNTAPAYIQHADRVSAATTATAVSGTDDVGILFTNQGATAEVNFTLPSAVAQMTHSFYCQDSDGVKVTAASGDTIRVAGSVSAGAGNIASTTVGSFVKLVAINATEWVAVSVIGTWVVT